MHKVEPDFNRRRPLSAKSRNKGDTDERGAGPHPNSSVSGFFQPKKKEPGRPACAMAGSPVKNDWGYALLAETHQKFTRSANWTCRLVPIPIWFDTVELSTPKLPPAVDAVNAWPG